MLKFFKKIRSEPVASVVMVLLVMCFCAAGFSGFDALRLTPKSTDTYTIDSRNTSGTTTFSVTPDGLTALTGITGTGVVSSTNITDITRSIPLSIVSAWLEGTGPIGIDGTTAPGVSVNGDDGIISIVYATSAERASLGWTFAVPADYSTALAFRMLTSTSSNTATSGFGISWELWVNKDATTFDAAPYSQTTATMPAGTMTPAASNALLTFTADATALAGIAAGDWVTILIGNADTRDAGATTEIKGLEGRYTATQ